eukprot:13469784-Alexandrium_andersonii.AAC.1
MCIRDSSLPAPNCRDRRPADRPQLRRAGRGHGQRAAASNRPAVRQLRPEPPPVPHETAERARVAEGAGQGRRA